MQFISNESRKAMLPLLKPIFERQKILQAAASTPMEGVTFCYYQCHDATCIYELTAHGSCNDLRIRPYFVNVIKATKQEMRIMYVHLF